MLKYKLFNEQRGYMRVFYEYDQDLIEASILFGIHQKKMYISIEKLRLIKNDYTQGEEDLQNKVKKIM